MSTAGEHNMTTFVSIMHVCKSLSENCAEYLKYTCVKFHWWTQYLVSHVCYNRKI